MTTARSKTTKMRPNGGGSSVVEVPSTAAPLWTIKDVSDYLGIPVQTLYQWRHQGIGPKAYRCGRHLRYEPAAVARWLAEDVA